MNRRLLALSVAIFVTILSFTAVRIHADRKAPVTPVQAPVAVVTPKPVTRADLLAAVNTERAKYGVAPLVEDARLDASAQAKADDECANGYFGHVSPSGVKGVTTAENALNDINGDYDENLAEPNKPTIVNLMYAWVHSAPHHEAMVSTKYTHTGFGFCSNQFVEHFYGLTS